MYKTLTEVFNLEDKNAVHFVMVHPCVCGEHLSRLSKFMRYAVHPYVCGEI